jgi:hypothetical protein
VDQNQWNSLVIVQLVVSVLTPVAVAAVGFFISRSVRTLEERQWFNQKLIEKRIELLDDVLPELNDLFCYFVWVGPWKALSPPDVLERKRALDRTFFSYKPFFPAATMDAYDAFVHSLFKMYAGVGKNAQLRTLLRSPNGSRDEVFLGEWNAEWADCFASDGDYTSISEIHQKYDRLLAVLGADIGAEPS